MSAHPAVLGDDPPVPGPLPGTVETWLVRVAESAGAAVANAGVLDEDESRRVAATKHEAGRRRYLTAHVGLRVLLGGRLDVPPERIRFHREACPMCGGPHGRPAVEGRPDVHFSMSHSGDTVLYALAPTAVGADIESPSARHERFDLAAYLHPGERAAIARQPPEHRAAAVLSCWVRKEAYLKGTGAGIAAGVAGVHVGLAAAFAGNGPQGAPPTPDGWVFRDVDAPEGYAAAVAVAIGAGDPAWGTGPLTPRPLRLQGPSSSRG
ncbi:4'-phosphopantetheinyl transferase superfamily protein [Streptomyces sp. NPDC006733]|uniref:4'-phosphopantetheinyl transferase family protein n=1 Tax=Streptomyces sp. NPDC006733 TaxID=3155460 RepID=UPI0033FAA4D3